ncbi:hypothetical protein CYLTODRAFT_330085, partial [Cylindrobasidium torrendii FP15055 ss-10]
DMDMPLPDPRMLTLHGICARVAHMSGAAEYFDGLDRDHEMLKEVAMLAGDGSSS